MDNPVVMVLPDCAVMILTFEMFDEMCGADIKNMNWESNEFAECFWNLWESCNEAFNISEVWGKSHENIDYYFKEVEKGILQFVIIPESSESRASSTFPTIPYNIATSNLVSTTSSIKVPVRTAPKSVESSINILKLANTDDIIDIYSILKTNSYSGSLGHYIYKDTNYVLLDPKVKPIIEAELSEYSEVVKSHNHKYLKAALFEYGQLVGTKQLNFEKGEKVCPTIKDQRDYIRKPKVLWSNQFVKQKGSTQK